MWTLVLKPIGLYNELSKPPKNGAMRSRFSLMGTSGMAKRETVSVKADVPDG